MNEKWKWDDLRFFLSVSRAGGLSGAIAMTNVSAPTLGRRVAALESALGVRLFRKRRDGYDLTVAGSELRAYAEEMERSALKVDRWLVAADPRPTVRIAAGAWTSRFIAQHIAALASDEDDLVLDLSTGVVAEDLMRREANLGIRNRRPDGIGLAGKRLTHVEFAIYGEGSYLAAHPEALDDQRFSRCNWIMYSPNGPKTPSAIWLDQKLHQVPKLTCSTAHAVLETAQAGAGLCVLPCFIGDLDEKLARASGLIHDLRHEQWLVSHNDDRHLSNIRLISKRLGKLFKSNEALFNGRLME